MVDAPLSSIARVVADRLRPMSVTGRFKCTRKSLLIVDRKWVHDEGADTSDSRTENRFEDHPDATLLDGLSKNPMKTPPLVPFPSPHCLMLTPVAAGSLT